MINEYFIIYIYLFQFAGLMKRIIIIRLNEFALASKDRTEKWRR